MSEPEFLKCVCSHCGQSIEYPAEGSGQTVPCPTCEKFVQLTPPAPPAMSAPIPIFTATIQENPKAQKSVRSNLSKLTEETIRARTKAGDTPLHRAAKNGQFGLIPNHLLSIDLFMVRNNDGNTPLHVAARHGSLNQVPRQFLTKETLTLRDTPQYAPEGFYFTGSGYKALTETVLHVAALYGHGDQIPEEYLTPEFLCIEAKGHAQTVLHYFAMSKTLGLIPPIHAKSKMWDMKDRQGMTARDVQDEFIRREKYVASVRSEPVTEKQKAKLRFFDYQINDGMTKGQASDALDQCARDFPEIERAYYNRPATDEQMDQIRAYLKDTPEEVEEPYTYAEAKDLILDLKNAERQQERMEFDRQCLIELAAREDFYPSLTVARVKKAAKALDAINPEWITDKNRQDLLIKKVMELNPALAAKEGWPTLG